MFNKIKNFFKIKKYKKEGIIIKKLLKLEKVNY